MPPTLQQATSAHSSAGDSQTLTGKSGSVSRGVTVPFSWVQVHTRFCCALRECFPGGSQSFCWMSRLGSLLWSLELSQHWENFFGVIVLWLGSPLLVCFIVELMAISSKSTEATLCSSYICCSQSPCPRALLTHVSPARRHSNTQRQVWLSLLWGWVIFHCVCVYVYVHTTSLSIPSFLVF